jgi:hypothetical protein
VKLAEWVQVMVVGWALQGRVTGWVLLQVLVMGWAQLVVGWALQEVGWV